MENPNNPDEAYAYKRELIRMVQNKSCGFAFTPEQAAMMIEELEELIRMIKVYTAPGSFK